MEHVVTAMEAQQRSINALQAAVLEMSKTIGILHQNHEGQAELARSERRILLERIEALERRDEGQRELILGLLQMINEDRGVLNIPIL